MTEISNYDHFGYEYEKYWEKRKYENEAEKILLTKIFSKYRGVWFLDIGGSYGRLTSTYYSQFSQPIILDYSLKTLQRNYESIKYKYPNAELIAANAYKMPFKENTFDGALMVRVLHHIEKPTEYFNQLERVMTNRSVYVQEFANKVHIKARIRALLQQNWQLFSKEPYQVPTKSNFEGTKEGEEALFYNYHPKYIREALKGQNFEIKKKHGCSYLRSQGLKNLVGENLMLFFEKIFQATLSWTNISPSIVFESILREKTEHIKNANELKNILECPKCHSELEFTSDNAKCKKCKKNFDKKDNIWDFRID